MLSKWNQVGDTPLVAEVGIDLSTSLEGLDHVAIGCKQFSLGLLHTPMAQADGCLVKV